MKQFFMQQGSGDWLNARLGIPTSSCFDQIITPAKGDFSKSARKYAFQLAAEAILRVPLENLDNLPWVGRGKELEPQAIAHYAFLYDMAPEEIRQVGFITNDAGTYGCSPDRLLPFNGGLEVKCPAPHTHIGYHIEGPGDAYKVQVQGQMFVAELDYVDFWSWHPELPPFQLRVGRDTQFLIKLEAALGQFNDLRLSVLENLRQKGFFDARPIFPVAPMGNSYGSTTEVTYTAEANG